MNQKNNTVLITGGSTGIGLALAKQFLDNNDYVIICARNEKRLEEARKKHPELKTYICDVSDEQSIEKLASSVLVDHPNLNILVNNAGSMHIHDVVNDSLPFKYQQQEIMTNFYGTVALCNVFLPHLQRQANATILNITSGLAYMPFMPSPVYAATKAAAHSYSLSIRQALKNTSVRVVEALPPMVDTEMTEGLEMQGMKKMSPEKLAQSIYKRLNKGQLEIRPGDSAMMIKMYKLFPWMINAVMGKMTPKMLINLPKYD